MSIEDIIPNLPWGISNEINLFLDLSSEEIIENNKINSLYCIATRYPIEKLIFLLNPKEIHLIDKNERSLRLSYLLLTDEETRREMINFLKPRFWIKGREDYMFLLDNIPLFKNGDVYKHNVNVYKLSLKDIKDSIVYLSNIFDRYHNVNLDLLNKIGKGNVILFTTFGTISESKIKETNFSYKHLRRIIRGNVLNKYFLHSDLYLVNT